MSESAEILGAAGPFSARLPGFVARPSQQQMAARIERALHDHEVFVAESGTGTGKTFAYLVPALLSGKKVLISTGTKGLQDQLYHRDLPLVREALRVPVTTALLKGRANYLCLHRLERAELDTQGERRRVALARVRDWAARTRSGDIAELTGLPEETGLWPLVTSTVENCLGSECPRYADCFVNRARREALAAEVLVVNHHLFFADLALREEGFGQLLPGVEGVIFDEAHQLPEVASAFFGLALSGHQLLELSRDTLAEDRKEHGGVEALAPAARALEKASADFRLALGIEPRRDPWSRIADDAGVRAALEVLTTGLSRLTGLLEGCAPRGQGLANCYRRAMTLLDRLVTISGTPPADYVCWFETSARSYVLRLTPLEIATPFRQQLSAADKAWIFTSATLAVKADFAHFQAQLGLEQAATGCWESPFDFSRQALLYLPPGLPEPAAPDYTQRVLEVALPVLKASDGRAFLLFTSHRALKAAAERLAGRLDFPLLVQGSQPPAELLRQFRAAGNAVLLGTATFWEGVDVRGPALSCVIIDKLPFAAPDDPVLQARGAALEDMGRNPFREIQLPEAVITLKQGVGRLIRDETDRGVLVLCDPRVRTRGYGKTFLDSLPPMPRTHELADVQRFFAAETDARDEAGRVAPPARSG